MADERAEKQIDVMKYIFTGVGLSSSLAEAIKNRTAAGAVVDDAAKAVTEAQRALAAATALFAAAGGKVDLAQRNMDNLLDTLRGHGVDEAAFLKVVNQTISAASAAGLVTAAPTPTPAGVAVDEPRRRGRRTKAEIEAGIALAERGSSGVVDIAVGGPAHCEPHNDLAASNEDGYNDLAVVEDAPVEDAPVEDAPVEDAPVEDAPVEDAPVEDAPVEDVAAEDIVTHGAPVEDTVVEYVAVEDAAVVEQAALKFSAPRFNVGQLLPVIPRRVPSVQAAPPVVIQAAPAAEPEPDGAENILNGLTPDF